MCPDHGNACRQVDGSIKKYGGRAPFSDMSSSTKYVSFKCVLIAYLHMLHLYSDNCVALHVLKVSPISAKQMLTLRNLRGGQREPSLLISYNFW